MALAVGALVAGFVGIPAALGGEQHHRAFSGAELHGTGRCGAGLESCSTGGPPALRPNRPRLSVRRNSESESEASRGVELGLMGFSVLVAAIGIGLAWKFYVTSPEISERLAERFAGAHRLLSHKYYVDELYDATVIAGTWKSAPRPVDRRSERRRRRRERNGPADDHQLVVLRPHG